MEIRNLYLWPKEIKVLFTKRMSIKQDFMPLYGYPLLTHLHLNVLIIFRFRKIKIQRGVEFGEDDSWQ